VQVARAVKLPFDGYGSISDNLAVFAVSTVVAAGVFEFAEFAQTRGQFVADLFRASLTGVGTMLLVKALASLVGAEAANTIHNSTSSTSNSNGATAAVGASPSSQVVATQGQHALVLQQRQPLSTTSTYEFIPTVVPEICWEVGEGQQLRPVGSLRQLQHHQAWTRVQWLLFFCQQLQRDYDCAVQTIISSAITDGSLTVDSIISSSMGALPAAGGSWASCAPLAAPGATQLPHLLASGHLMHQAGHSAALPGAKRSWVPRPAARCPGSRLPAGPLFQNPGAPLAPSTMPNVSGSLAGTCQPIINHSSSSSPASPYALLAAPAPPAALLPAAAASLAVIRGRGTFPSHPLADLEEELLAAANNILTMSLDEEEEEGGGNGGGGVPALVSPGGVAVATRTLTTTLGAAQVRTWVLYNWGDSWDTEYRQSQNVCQVVLQSPSLDEQGHRTTFQQYLHH
jgi:hypothetical protein